MDYATLFTELLKLSPFVATLFLFLFTIWRSMQKKDEALMNTMKEHATTMLLVQEKSITAQNNSADANRQLATAIGDFKDHISEKIDDLKAHSTKNGSLRRPALITESKSAAA